MRNQLRQFKRAIYSLKRQYGGPLDIYHVLSETQDPTTGKKVKVRIKYHIKRAIIMPITLARQLSLLSAYVKIDSAMPPSGFDIDETIVLIDNKDYPDVEIGANDYVIIRHERYQIKTAQELEGEVATMLKLKHLKGAEPYEIHDLVFKQKLIFNQELENE